MKQKTTNEILTETVQVAFIHRLLHHHPSLSLPNVGIALITAIDSYHHH